VEETLLLIIAVHTTHVCSRVQTHIILYLYLIILYADTLKFIKSNVAA